MNAKDFVNLYQSDSLTRLVSTSLEKPHTRLHLKGLVGSMDTVIGAATFQINQQENKPANFIFIVHDREEAFFVQNDLQNLLYPRDIYLFPASYKRPYQFEEVEKCQYFAES